MRMSVVLVWLCRKVAEPIEDRVIVQLSLPQLLLNGYVLLKFDETWRIWPLREFYHRCLIHQLLKVIDGLASCVLLVEGIGDNVG